ncbi:hypothetical protein GCM10020331_035330 [Ectobacillus funiculus]
MNSLKLKHALQQFFYGGYRRAGCNITAYFFPGNMQAKGTFLAKESGVFAGTDVITAGFHLLDPDIKIELYKKRWRSRGEGRHPWGSVRTNCAAVNR